MPRKKTTSKRAFGLRRSSRKKQIARARAKRSKTGKSDQSTKAEENVTVSSEELEDKRDCLKYARSHTMATRVIPGNAFSLGREVVTGNDYKTATLVNDLQSTVRNILTGAVTITVSHANGFGGSTWVIRGPEEDPIVTVRYKNDFHCPFKDSGDDDQSNVDQEPRDESSRLKFHTFGHANLREVIKQNAKLEPRLIKVEMLDFSSRQDSLGSLTVPKDCASSEGGDRNLRVPRCGGVLSSAAVGNVCESFFNAADETFVIEHEGKDAPNIDDSRVLSKNKANAPPELVAKDDGSRIDSSATACIRGIVPNVDEPLKLSVESTSSLNRQHSAESCCSTHEETSLTSPGISTFDEQKARIGEEASEDQESFSSVSVSSVEGNKLYQCSYCDEKFHGLYTKRDHERGHRNDAVHRCSYCEKTFTRLSFLKKHIKTHTGEKPFKCSHCDKRFCEYANWKTHERVHSAERPYQCSHCEKRFSRSSVLTLHERLHANEKPFECALCERKFSTSNTLKKHESVHLNERPYQCSHCDKRFIELSRCKMHERIHTGEKPYQCSRCGKTFFRAHSLTLHERSHENQNSYRCLQFEKRSPDLASLQNHAYSHRKEAGPETSAGFRTCIKIE